MSLCCLSWIFASQLPAQALEKENAPSSEMQHAGVSLVERDLPVETWNYYIRNYRRDHNIALLGVIGQGRFQVNHFGSLSSKLIRKEMYGARVHYAYHIPIGRYFGYLLGSSFGATHYSGEKGQFRIEDTVAIFPGLLGGLDYNFNARWRILVFSSVNLERFDRIAEYDPGLDEEGQAKTVINVTMYGIDEAIAIDYFAKIRWAIRSEIHFKQFYYQRPRNSESYAVNANIKANEIWFGLGVNYHFL